MSIGNWTQLTPLSSLEVWGQDWKFILSDHGVTSAGKQLPCLDWFQKSPN